MLHNCAQLLGSRGKQHRIHYRWSKCILLATAHRLVSRQPEWLACVTSTYSIPVFLVGAESWRAGARFGEADRVRRDRRERPRRGGLEWDNGSPRKTAPPAPVTLRSEPGWSAAVCGVRAGARWPGLFRKAEAGASVSDTRSRARRLPMKPSD